MAGKAARFDAIILGAGIVGCACARECAQAGLRVAVVEPGEIAGGATGAAMGHVVVMDDSPALLALTKYSQSLWNELRVELPASVEFETRGTVWVAADDREMAHVYAMHKRYADAGVSASVLDAHDLAAAEPNLRAGLAGGLLAPGDAVIDPPAAAAFFLDQAMRAGAVLLRGYAAIRIGNRSCTLANGEMYSAQHIVVATGAETKLLPWLNIRKRKGHLVITERYPDLIHHQLVELGYLQSAGASATDSVAFNIQPRRSGQLLIGSSRQFGQEEAAVDEAIMARMLERACIYMPVLASVSIERAWTGFRAATVDKLPIIGPAGEPGLFIAAGFEGLGITTSVGAARLVLDNLVGRRSQIDATPFLPSRLHESVAFPARAISR